MSCHSIAVLAACHRCRRRANLAYRWRCGSDRYPCIVAAVAQVLARERFVSPIDVFLGMGLLDAADLEKWKCGATPYLERVLRCNMPRASGILRILRFHAHDLNLGSSIIPRLHPIVTGQDITHWWISEYPGPLGACRQNQLLLRAGANSLTGGSNHDIEASPMKPKLICACAAILCVLSIPAPAADEVRRVPLFDGKTLDGWDVIKCEAVVQDGNHRIGRKSSRPMALLGNTTISHSTSAACCRSFSM